ncbi:GtrA family protein [Candidatus Saccharibacteria bacterium]|nr:GtrA family protein [Candidatus Saccharibacteria bacterium]
MVKKPNRKKLIIQFLEYMVGGGVYFWSGYAVFAIFFSVVGWDWLWAKILADFVGWNLNFLVQRYWAFNDPRLKHKAVQISGRYIAITASNFVIDYLMIWGLKGLGVTPYLGFFVTSGFFTVWNYLWYKFWVFNPNRI